MNNQQKQKPLSGKASEDQIEKWKEQYKDVFEVVVADKVCYMKPADRTTMRAALTFIEKDRMRYMEIIVQNCWLGGDEEMKTNDDYFFGLTDIVPEITAKRSAEIKKL